MSISCACVHFLCLYLYPFRVLVSILCACVAFIMVTGSLVEFRWVCIAWVSMDISYDFFVILLRCAVRVLLPSGVPCDDGNPFMALARWPRTHWLTKYEFEGCAVQRAQPPVRVRMVFGARDKLGAHYRRYRRR